MRALSTWPDGRRIRVLIADDEASLREVLRDLISGDPGLELVAEASDADEAITQALRHRPDVCLTDVKMPGGGGQWFAKEILRDLPKVKIIALTAYEDRVTVTEMLSAGAVGYLVKGGDFKEILSAIHGSVHGESVFSADVTSTLVKELSPRLRREADDASDLRTHYRGIRKILDGDALRMVYQPIVDLASRKVVAMEALARFDVTPVRSPDIWFADAEQVGLLVELEIAAIRAAIKRIEMLPEDARLSVNVSPGTLMSMSASVVFGDVDYSRMIIEITEHAAVDDYEGLAAALRTTREAGALLAVDDFGSGFASLRHILRLDPDLIKLDVSLTQSIDTEIKKEALAAALATFGSKIGMTLIAEGIETENELNALTAMGISWGQGFYLGVPSPLGSDPDVLSDALALAPRDKGIVDARSAGYIASDEGS